MDGDAPPLIVVAALLVDTHGDVLVQLRPVGGSLAGLWEFPGGKTEAGETPEEALMRELAEELGIGVEPADITPLTFASEILGERQLILLLFLCRRWAGTPVAHHADALQWVPPARLRALDMPRADRPMISIIEATLSSA